MRRLPVQALLLLLLLLPPPPEAAAQAPGFFWHISDVHVLYSRNVSWAEPIPNKPFGDHGADTIFESGLYQSLTAEMAALNPAPDFILLSGDISNEVRDIREATRILKQRFPTTFVYVSSGNHDVNLGFYNRANVTDPERLGPGTGTRDWIKSNSATEGDPDLGMASQRLGLLDSVWSSTGWLSSPGCPGCAASFRKAGVYSTAVATAPGLRVVNLNTNPWLGADLKPAAEANDPAEMFEYLEHELALARNSSEKVYLQGHIPPGFFERQPQTKPDAWTEYSNQRMETTLAAYKDVVKGFFHGHDHSDAIRLHRDASGRPTVVSYLTPAGAPLNQNPGFRSYTFDRKTFNILDYKQYYLDLNKANGARKMEWQLEYQAKQYFQLKSMEPAAWEALHQKFLVNDTHFQKFAAINYVQYDLGKCSGSCKAVMICALFAVTTPEHRCEEAGLITPTIELIVSSFQPPHTTECCRSDAALTLRWLPRLHSKCMASFGLPTATAAGSGGGSELATIRAWAADGKLAQHLKLTHLPGQDKHPDHVEA